MGDLFDQENDPGAIRMYERHRLVEQSIVDYIDNKIIPFVEKNHDYELVNSLRTMSYKLLFCRRRGPFGVTGAGDVVVAWEEKCGCSRYCPDEARHEALRLRDRYVPERLDKDPDDTSRTVLEHVAQGGRVYKAVISPLNYPGGRLREGMRYEMKRFRDRLIRPKKKGRNKWGIEGALIIQEAPLGKDRDWNVHLNVLFLTRGYLDYEALQETLGCQLKIREYTEFDEKGLASLFNELFKYGTRTVPEKSAADDHDIAPSMIEWTPAEFLEWYHAQKRFRRTRAYGCFHGVGKPDKVNELPKIWLGMLTLTPSGYRTEWASDNYKEISRQALRDIESRDLCLIRGDKSTRKPYRYQATGPP